VNDAPSAIDPLVAEGPRVPVETLRPGLNLQRVLLLGEPGPMMADLATGDIRRYESGPPVSVPMVSDTFDLGKLHRMQVQVIRDPRPSPLGQSLLSLDIASAGCIVDVRISADNVLEVATSGEGAAAPARTKSGTSPAFVIVVEQADGKVEVAARNAETLESISSTVELADLTSASVTVCGPSVRATGCYGRRRSIPVHIDLQHHVEPADQLRQAARKARTIAGAVRRRIG
jgi:hypothetical protein